MKSEYQRDDDARDYLLSDKAGFSVMARAREIARNAGESFVVFVGSLAVPRTAVRAFRDVQDAQEFARDERDMHRGFRTAPKVHLKRIKV